LKSAFFLESSSAPLAYNGLILTKLMLDVHENAFAKQENDTNFPKNKKQSVRKSSTSQVSSQENVQAEEIFFEEYRNLRGDGIVSYPGIEPFQDPFQDIYGMKNPPLLVSEQFPMSPSEKNARNSRNSNNSRNSGNSKNSGNSRNSGKNIGKNSMNN